VRETVGGRRVDLGPVSGKCHRSSEIVVFWTHAGWAAADDIINHLGGLAVS
jgi:hypothetical protein